MKIKMELDFLNKMVRAISVDRIIAESTLNFKSERVEAVNMDITHSVISICCFKKDCFEEYDITEDTEVNIDAEKVSKMLKSLRGNKVVIEKKADNVLLLSTDNDKLKIPLLVPRTMTIPNMVHIEENGSIIVDMEYKLNELIPVLSKELQTLGERDTLFEVKEGKVSIVQQSTDNYSFSSLIKEQVESTDFVSRFNTDFLKNIFHSCISSEIYVRLAKKMPILLNDETPEYQTVFMLAPMLTEDEYEEKYPVGKNNGV